VPMRGPKVCCSVPLSCLTTGSVSASSGMRHCKQAGWGLGIAPEVEASWGSAFTSPFSQVRSHDLIPRSPSDASHIWVGWTLL
jgi:hypothetical protein